MLSRRSVGTYQGHELTRNSSGNTQPQSSQLAEPLQTDPDLKSGTGVRELISTLNRRREKGIIKTEARASGLAYARFGAHTGHGS